METTFENACKMENKYQCIKGKKHFEKKRNCLLQAISLFLTMFSTATISLVCQNTALCGNGLKRALHTIEKVE